MKEHILAFGCETIAPLLTQTFAPRKMAVKAVPLADYAQTVGALAGAADCLRTEEVYAGLPLGEPMLVFCGFYGDRMNHALNAMRRTGLRIPYKAMLTAANRGWRPAELFAELQKEHLSLIHISETSGYMRKAVSMPRSRPSRSLHRSVSAVSKRTKCARPCAV